MYIFSDESNLSAHETSLRNTFRKRPAAPLHSFSTPTSPTVINRSPFCPPVALITVPIPKQRPFQQVNSHQQNVFAPPHPFDTGKRYKKFPAGDEYLSGICKNYTSIFPDQPSRLQHLTASPTFRETTPRHEPPHIVFRRQNIRSDLGYIMINNKIFFRTMPRRSLPELHMR